MQQRASEVASPPETLAQAVWGTLSEVQKAAVLQALLLVCQQLAAQWSGEATHEPVSPPG
jgi:hypothetical protein